MAPTKPKDDPRDDPRDLPARRDDPRDDPRDEPRESPPKPKDDPREVPPRQTLLNGGPDDEQAVLEQTRARYGQVHGAPRRVEQASYPLPAAATDPTVNPEGGQPWPTMKVRATHLGYYGDMRRRTDDVFTIQERHFSSRWMQPVSGSTPEKITSGKEDLRRQHDEMLAGRRPTGDAQVLKG